MSTIFRNTALAVAAAGMTIPVIPAAAADFGAGASAYEQSWDHSRRHRDRDYRDRYGHDTRYYGRNYHSEPVYRDTRVWRGNDGRYYCRKKDGTTGLIVGAAVGALLGRSVDRYGDRTPGTLIGGALGALLGKKVDQGTSCR
jgi:hypothetical protein